MVSDTAIIMGATPPNENGFFNAQKVNQNAKTNVNEKTFSNFDSHLKNVFHFFDQDEDGILKHANMSAFQEMSKAYQFNRKLLIPPVTKCVVTFDTLKKQVETRHPKEQERRSSYQKQQQQQIHSIMKKKKTSLIGSSIQMLDNGHYSKYSRPGPYVHLTRPRCIPHHKGDDNSRWIW
ncbi:hypothetical protein RFI_37147 [Reticulomyxa filosa]|uniref:Uncharacterized protein n=1 Tax=Reticulomyxa filosa TaxID=46433 RepID=X6LHV8_RETFI|nr:hypothetical protein RFI_37147 [Reticulomyxa filosa]|eukprot:ETO00300.1 hypothetical protein RFI_37147 [Reticulomyxa filosa]